MWNDIKELLSSDNDVKKFVFKSEDAVCEAVLYKYPTYEDRTVICCSVMSGCPMGCRFCGTGDYFVRNLTVNEIVFQITYLLGTTNIESNKIKKLSILLMSMGEPMINYKVVEEALIKLYDLYPHAALLISTAAPDVPNNFESLIQLAKKIPTIGLQFSVHESTDEARNLLIPFKNKLTLKQMGQWGEKFYYETGRQPFFNYCVHEKNNKIEDVERLVKLFDPKIFQATISVICERDETIAGANIRQLELATEFISLFLEKGYSTRIFNPAGQDDIGGGCGMLWHVQNWIKQNPDKIKKSIGFGNEVKHMPK